MTRLGDDPFDLADQFLKAHGHDEGYVQNPADEDTLAIVGEFARTLQAAGGDIATFDEEDWRDVLMDRFGVAEDDVADYLETLASWGVVDNI